MERTLNYSRFGGTTGNRLIRTAHVIAFIYPFLLAAAFYGAWLLAWAKLGHPPRESWDDPAQTLGVFYYVSALPLLGLPVAAIVAMVSIFVRFLQPGPRFAAFMTPCVVAALWVAAIVLLRCDPLGVGRWWMD
jgi:hypothetical protein